MVFLDKLGWPVVRIKDRYILNFIRLLIHTRKITRGYWDGYKIIKSKEMARKNPSLPNRDRDHTRPVWETLEEN